MVITPPFDAFETFSSIKNAPRYIKVSLHKASKKYKLSLLYNKVFSPAPQPTFISFKNSVEWIYPDLTSSKPIEFHRKFSIPGQNNDEKRRNMKIMAETNAAFCWQRVLFLYRCYTFNEAIPKQKPLSGPWTLIREDAWKSALVRSEAEALLVAKMVFKQKLSSKPDPYSDTFLIPEHKIDRKDFEKNLQALQHHIHVHLLKIESISHMDQKNHENHLFALQGTQREHFVIDLASKYWKMNPIAKHDEVFSDYCKRCLAGKILSRSSWNKIVRERKLDPRPASAKKRGNGKKPF